MKQDWEDKKEELGTQASDNPTVDLRWGWPVREFLSQGTAASPLLLYISHSWMLATPGEGSGALRSSTPFKQSISGTITQLPVIIMQHYWFLTE